MALPGETLRTGASPKCADCGTTVELTVCRSNAGYYIGSLCCCGPYSRESGYYADYSKATEDLMNGFWTPR